MTIDWPGLWKLIESRFACDSQSIHGPSHWRRVERNGLLIADQNGADPTLVRLFAVLHDSQRVHDGHDEIHGARAAEFAETLRNRLFLLSDDDFATLTFACRWHTHGRKSDDPTVGACWDADRLDLGRVGITPAPDYMSTNPGRDFARKLNPFEPARRR